MNQLDDQQGMLHLAAKLGVPMSVHTVGWASLRFPNLRVIDYLPDMMVMIRSLVAYEAFAYRRDPITVIERGLLVSFQNVFRDRHEAVAGATNRWTEERPHVRLMPSHLAGEVSFPPQAHIKQITLLIEADYLKRLLGHEHHQFSYLLKAESTYWIEEFMSPPMAALVDQLVTTPEVSLPDFYYRLKAEELLYVLFKNLSSRESVAHQPMNTQEIEAVYRVRNALAASLDKALPVGELVKLGGMNEQKLRKRFGQVFGQGLYAYFQHLRMEEAARLLTEERLSVSETGYRLGFTNLSHFGRLFEAHLGVTPKKYRTHR